MKISKYNMENMPNSTVNIQDTSTEKNIFWKLIEHPIVIIILIIALLLGLTNKELLPEILKFILKII